jgi:hypothetical protein
LVRELRSLYQHMQISLSQLRPLLTLSAEISRSLLNMKAPLLHPAILSPMTNPLTRSQLMKTILFSKKQLKNMDWSLNSKTGLLPITQLLQAKNQLVILSSITHVRNHLLLLQTIRTVLSLITTLEMESLTSSFRSQSILQSVRLDMRSPLLPPSRTQAKLLEFPPSLTSFSMAILIRAAPMEPSSSHLHVLIISVESMFQERMRSKSPAHQLKINLIAATQLLST